MASAMVVVPLHAHIGSMPLNLASLRSVGRIEFEYCCVFLCKVGLTPPKTNSMCNPQRDMNDRLQIASRTDGYYVTKTYKNEVSIVYG